jgi:hypothetical protein
VCTRGASTAFVATAVERTVTGDAIVFAKDRPSRLAALTGRGTLTAQPNRTACTTAGAANAADADQTAAAVALLTASAPTVTTTIQRTVRIDSVLGANGGSRCLAALAGLRALSANGKTARRVIYANSVDAIETAAAVGAEVCA